MTNPISLGAAQRTIEQDSYLMQVYMSTPKTMPISHRICVVFNSEISRNAKMLSAYLETKERLEAES